MSGYRTIPIMPARPAADRGENVEDEARRRFMKLMGASMALATGACTGPPPEEIMPYVHAPEYAAPEHPVFLASAFVHRGYAEGVLVETNLGRPTKIEGNPSHPASLGGTSLFAQASVLELWDPYRAGGVIHRGMITSWGEFKSALYERLARFDRNGGAGLRLLTGTVTSPTLLAQLQRLSERYPEAVWHCYEPLHEDNRSGGARLAFGRAVDTVYRFDRARVIVSFAADFLHDHPGSVRYAHDFAAARKIDASGPPARLYAVEATPGLAGAAADERIALPPQEIERLVWRVAARLGIGPATDFARNRKTERWEAALASELQARRGAAVLIGGIGLSAETHALIHAINERLGNAGRTVLYIEPVAGGPQRHLESIEALAHAARAGSVDTLVMVGGNPVYNAPADLDFAAALTAVPLSVHLGLDRNETAERALWHLPQAHGYEQWSDARAYDGTATVLQPAIRPLHAGRSAHEVLSLLERVERDGRDIVRDHWAGRWGVALQSAQFESRWRESLQQGHVADSASAGVAVRVAGTLRAPALGRAALTALLVRDPSVSSGEYAGNAWLQEVPRPLTKLSWDNAALVSPATARSLEVKSGDIVEVQMGERALEVPVWVLPGQADGVIALPVGYGRSAAGPVGTGVGFDAYRLLTMAAARDAHPVAVRRTGRRHAFADTQGHNRMEEQKLVRAAAYEEYRRNPHFATDEPEERVPAETLYPPYPYEEYAWGMAIDLNACIGCNACIVACQAENNIPVVGKEQVALGREMLWLRVDRYYEGPLDHPRTYFEPVPCMHCELAPCELVCPVDATLHDSDGLNLQVYNRCIGTRWCSNNCPYKVRRFNFLDYTGGKPEMLKALRNPEVTVRSRGVMEKCTYCLQRISRAKIEAETRGRKVADGEVVTACQAACPTRAIVFGNISDPQSRVSEAKRSPLNYVLLPELNTRPRTSYLARVFNPDKRLDGNEG